MTGPIVTNVAGDTSHVGTQIGVLHIDGDYVPPPEASPEDLFRVGVRYLEARIPEEARRLIEDAVARGLRTTDEVNFYRLVALLSGRTLRHLDQSVVGQLASICHRIDRTGRGAWRAGLRCVLALVDSSAGTDPELTVKKIEALPKLQRDVVLDHLGVLRDGPFEDRMWRLSVERARSLRMSADRTDRVWIFFQPIPAGARARDVRSMATAPADWLRAVGGAAILLYAFGRIGVLLWRAGGVLPILAHLVAVAGAVVFVWYGSEWHFRLRRIKAKDAEFSARPRDASAPPDGFADRVDRLFDDYFARYVPRDTDRVVWLEQTAGIRQTLRDELVEIYREDRTGADKIAWLVRYLVADVRRRWEQGTLVAYREELRAPFPLMAKCIAGGVAVVAAAFWIAPAAVREAPLAGTVCILLALASAVVATLGGFRIDAERRRVQADANEYHDRLRAREEAYGRWTRKLARRPTDAEMARWLESDRRILVDETMRHYRLQASQVIAHAFIEAPGRSAKRGRIKYGPRRYSRYEMLLFLLTDDGVRQVDIELDFEKATSQRTQRLSYRFDTVASVRIDGTPTQRQTFELTLFNGPPVRVDVTEPGGDDVEGSDDAWTLSRVALDASGLPRTLDVMEGIAAEGKEWIRRRHGRAAEQLADLTEAIRHLIG